MIGNSIKDNDIPNNHSTLSNNNSLDYEYTFQMIVHQHH